MKWLSAPLGLLRDLVIGECWQLGVWVAAVFAGGAAISRLEVLPRVPFVLSLAVLVMIGAGVIVYLEASAALRRRPGAG